MKDVNISSWHRFLGFREGNSYFLNYLRGYFRLSAASYPFIMIIYFVLSYFILNPEQSHILWRIVGYPGGLIIIFAISLAGAVRGFILDRKKRRRLKRDRSEDTGTKLLSKREDLSIRFENDTLFIGKEFYNILVVIACILAAVVAIIIFVCG